MTLHLSEKRISIVAHFFYSLVVHLALLAFLFSLPLYRRGVIGAGPFWGYFVYLKSVKEAARKMPSIQGVKEAGLRAEKSNDKKSLKTAEGVVKKNVEDENKEKIMPSEGDEPQEIFPPKIQEAETAKETEMIPEEKEAEVISSYPEQASEETPVPHPTSKISESKTPETVNRYSALVDKDRNEDKPLNRAERETHESGSKSDTAIPAAGAAGEKPDILSPQTGQDIIAVMSDNKPGDERDIIASITPQENEGIKTKTEMPQAGIPMLLREIRIEVLFEGPETQGISARINKKPHPKSLKSGGSKMSEVDFTSETAEMKNGGKIRVKRIFLIASAEKGIYNVIIGNKVDREYNADIVFTIYEGKEKAKAKKYGTIKLTPNSMIGFKFILPEAVFWDDDEYFSGRIEDSNSMTKFKHETDLIWREEKDY